MGRQAGGGKWLVEGCRHVDVLDLRRDGYLQPPAPGSLPYTVTASCGKRKRQSSDMAALRLCLDRILPPRKDSPVAFELPEMKTLNDAVPAMSALAKAVGQGDLTPTEAGELTKMVQAFAKIIETAELEDRVRKLEETIQK